MGQNYTIADPYLFTVAQWLEADGVNLERIPRVIEHRERMLKSVQCKTSHRDRARLRPGCLGSQNRDSFKTKVTTIGAGFSITSPWPTGRGRRVQRERIVESQRAQRPEVRSRPSQAGSGTPEISEQIAMRRSCSPGSWACAFGSIRFR